MKWEELIAEARAAGVLAFCSEGIAVLKQVPTHHGPPQANENPSVGVPLAGEHRGERRESGQGQSQGAQQSPGP